jgi:hypothetical protein
VEAHRVARYLGSHIFQLIGSQMAVRSTLRAGHASPPPQILLQAESTPQGHSAAVRIRQV